MKFYLIVAKGKNRGMPILIPVDLFVIGTDQACQLRAQHPNLGRQHCAIAVRGRKVFVCDLGSGQPTYVNEELLPMSEEWPVHKGDHLTVGPLKFQITFNERALSQKDLEEWALRTLDEDSGPKKPAWMEIDDALHQADNEFEEAAKAAEAMINKMSALKGVVRGRLRISREGPITIVRVNETHLVEPPELAHIKMELHENLNQPNQRVLLDLKNVKRMSSAAVCFLAEIQGWLKTQGSNLAICRLRPELAHMVTDLKNMLKIKIFDDKTVALAKKW